MKRLSRGRSALVAALVSALGCSGGSPGPYNVILISLDTLRADRLSGYGYHRETSPNLDRFASRGLLFEHVVAECSWTLPSHITMLTGLHPSTHAVALPTLKPGADTVLLSEILRDRGYRTFGFTDGGYMDAARGFSRGFEVFDDSEKGLVEILRRTSEKIESLGDRERFFFFLHTYDIHCPYTPSPAVTPLFRSPDAEFVETAGRCGNPHFNTMLLSPGNARYLSDQYDASIREADDALGPFFVYLGSRGLLGNTIVIVTSDHGEEFMEHGQIGHERSLHREVLMVPLVIVAPDTPPARVVEPAGLVDLAPTVLDLLNLPIPADMEGMSLVRGPAAGGQANAALPARMSVLQWKLPLRSVMTRDWHLIVNDKNDRARLYSVPDDPGETRDLAPERPEEVAELRQRMAAFAPERRRRQPVAIDRLPPEQAERLRNLGYLN